MNQTTHTTTTTTLRALFTTGALALLIGACTAQTGTAPSANGEPPKLLDPTSHKVVGLVDQSADKYEFFSGVSVARSEITDVRVKSEATALQSFASKHEHSGGRVADMRGVVEDDDGDDDDDGSGDDNGDDDGVNVATESCWLMSEGCSAHSTSECCVGVTGCCDGGVCWEYSWEECSAR